MDSFDGFDQLNKIAIYRNPQLNLEFRLLYDDEKTKVVPIKMDKSVPFLGLIDLEKLGH